MNFNKQICIYWCKIMKITCTQLLIATVFTVVAMANSGHAQSILKRRVDIAVSRVNLDSFLKSLEKKADVKFVYFQHTLDNLEDITINVKQEKLEDILKLLSKSYQINYEVVNDRILLSKVSVYSDARTNGQPDPDPSQAVPVKGKVTDASGQPLPGVIVKLKGTAIATITDREGNYLLNVPDYNGILEFTFVGFTSKEISLDGKQAVNIQLIEENKILNEIVVVGYGTQKKVNLTGSVSSITATELENRPITQASQALAGLASGVSVSQGSGRPGNDGSSITIRGMGTFSGAGNSPLVLVDGLASSLNDVDPNNIKSISILKDAASASIYGTRAANGVILIETKRGSSGKLEVSYNNYIGWQKVTQLPDFVESAEYASLRNEANTNAGQGKVYSDEEIAKFSSGSDPDNYPNIPHLKNLVTSGSGFQTNHNVSFTGGDAKNSYLFSLGYLNQDGIVKKNSYNKYNFLLNFDSKIKDNLTLKVNLAGNSSNVQEPRQSSGDMTSIIGFAVREGPVFAGKKSDGTYGYQDNYSPEAWLDSESFSNYKNKYFLGGTELLWKIFNGFTLSGKVGYNYNSYKNTLYASDFIFDANKTVGPNNLTARNGDNSLLTLQSLAQYTKKIEKHDFSILAGFSQEQYREDWIEGYRQNFPNNELYTLNAGSATGMTTSGSGSEWALQSFFGRINYSFNDRYLLEINARYDGTSRFPSKGRWGLFPSISAGWRVSEESFIKDNFSWIDNLKVRASYGELGNQNIGNYPYQNILSLGQNYSYGGTIASGASVTTLANSDITWEKTKVTDIGMDLNIFKGKLGLVFDYFSKTTSDILYNISVSQVLGLTPSEVNAGEVKNTGFEVLLNYQTTIGKLKIGFVPNFSYVKNKITNLAGGLQQDLNKGLFVGQSINAIYGYVADGLFADAADVASYPTQPYAAEPGFVKYKDISGPNGVPDGKVDATYDRTIIGSTMPKYAYGSTLNLDYAGFDFSALFQGLGGYEKQMGSYQAFAFYNGGQIQRWQADNRWTTQNPDANAIYPKVTSLNSGSGTLLTSTYWNRNASFLRLKSLQLGYTFSNRLIERLKLSRLRIFVSGQNLFSWNKYYEGWDPEMNQNTGDNSPFYPITSVYTFGLNVKF